MQSLKRKNVAFYNYCCYSGQDYNEALSGWLIKQDKLE